MREQDRFEGLTFFLAVARLASFRAAARELGVTASAVSQAIRALEKRLGLPLFQRTTRRVALTEPGAALHARLAPATAEISAALRALDELKLRPAGLLRLTVPRLAVPLFIEPVLPRLRREHPDVAVEISVDDAFVDLAEGAYDAGIRVGESVAKDMVALRLTRRVRWLMVGAPSYFAVHGHPQTPRDLLSHSSIRYRYPRGGAIYRWQLVDGGRDVEIDVPGHITVNEGALAYALARQGLGLAYGPDVLLADDVLAGTLVPTLEAYVATSPGFCLYFARGAQTQPKLRAFIETLTSELQSKSYGPTSAKTRKSAAAAPGLRTGSTGPRGSQC